MIDPRTELRLGNYRDALEDDQCDALIVDAPYSARTHGGHDGALTGGTHASHRSGNAEIAPYVRYRADRDRTEVEYAQTRRAIDYDGWTPADVAAFCEFWGPRTRGWMVTITDHVLAPVWSAAFASTGRYVFAPLPWYAPGSRVRLAGDGPSSWTCWIVVARPRVAPYSKWGTLPGGYAIPSDRRSPVVGSKPLALMRAIVRDYSRPGDVVCDPCAGGGTTLRAAQLEGRRSVGSEMDPDTYAKAVERLRQPYTQPLALDAPHATQGDLI